MAIAMCRASAMRKTCAGKIESRSAVGIRIIREGTCRRFWGVTESQTSTLTVVDLVMPKRGVLAQSWHILGTILAQTISIFAN